MERKPDLGHVKVFGCVAHIKIPSAQTRKLDDRSRVVIHLGNEPGTKAYRCMTHSQERYTLVETWFLRKQSVGLGVINNKNYSHHFL